MGGDGSLDQSRLIRTGTFRQFLTGQQNWSHQLTNIFASCGWQRQRGQPFLEYQDGVAFTKHPDHDQSLLTVGTLRVMYTVILIYFYGTACFLLNIMLHVLNVGRMYTMLAHYAQRYGNTTVLLPYSLWLGLGLGLVLGLQCVRRQYGCTAIILCKRNMHLPNFVLFIVAVHSICNLILLNVTGYGKCKCD